MMNNMEFDMLPIPIQKRKGGKDKRGDPCQRVEKQECGIHCKCFPRREGVFGDGVIDFFVGRDSLFLSFSFPAVYITPPCVALARLFRPTTLARASSRIRNMTMIKERVTRSLRAGGLNVAY